MSTIVGAQITPRYRDVPLRTLPRKVWFTLFLYLSRDKCIHTRVTQSGFEGMCSMVESTAAWKLEHQREPGNLGNDHTYTCT